MSILIVKYLDYIIRKSVRPEDGGRAGIVGYRSLAAITAGLSEDVTMTNPWDDFKGSDLSGYRKAAAIKRIYGGP